ncbi:MAG: DUF6783 domain-containing protein [Ruminococcus sp.]
MRHNSPGDSVRIEERRSGPTTTEFGQNIPQKWGVQIAGMLFQTRSSTSKIKYLLY